MGELTPETVRDFVRHNLQRARLALRTEEAIVIEEAMANMIAAAWEAEVRRWRELAGNLFSAVETVGGNLAFLARETGDSRVQQVADSLAGSLATARERVRNTEEAK